MSAAARPRAGSLSRSGLLSGVSAVGSGVLCAGFSTYLFLSFAGRVLGPVGFAPVSALWAMVFIVGPGLFLPVQQELGRLIGVQRADRGGGQALRKVTAVAGGFSVVAVAGTLAVGPWLTQRLFVGNAGLLWCFELAVVTYAAAFVARGLLSGLGDYRHFGRLVAAEAVVRLVLGGALAVTGWRTATAFGVAIAVAPLLSTAVVTRMGARVQVRPGAPVGWHDVTRAMGWLVMGSMLAQGLANAGPLAVQVLATPDERNQAGRFLSALVIARLALYLFQAVQATLLPNVAELLAAGDLDRLRRALRRLELACAGLVVVSTVGALLLGPLAVRLLFGAGFEISGRTMAMLAGASACYVLAAALSGAAIAAGAHRASASAWLAGCLVFAIGTQLTHDLFLRVELGYLLGSCAASAVLLLALPWHLRRHRAAEERLVNGVDATPTL